MNIKADSKSDAVGFERKNFVDHLQALAAARPRDTAVVVVTEKNGEPVDKEITYQELDARVRALAALLQQQFQPDDRVLLLLDNNDHYVVAFFACLYAGMIAVPVFPPQSAREQHTERLWAIAHDCKASCVLTSRDFMALMGGDNLGGIESIAVDSVDLSMAKTWVSRTPIEDDIAFLQYTSGSTSAPKGVMVSHANLMANERAIEQALEITAQDVFVSWLPLFHDMGLIGGLLQPIHRGIKLVLMSPQFFLERPGRWLEAISRHRGSISGGPDFSYRLCIERIKDAQLKTLDLSHWRVAFSGAEPVRNDTLESFTSRFGDAGFCGASVNPCYGLAEATLMVTAGKPGVGMLAAAFQDQGLKAGEAIVDSNGKKLVSCGEVVAGHQVKIRAQDEHSFCTDDVVGEIWVSGPSVAKGYWNKQKETEEAFVKQGGTLWLRTGDLGFVHEDQLYVTGRIKDMIIVRGHNLYPQDIERAVEGEVDAVRKGRVAAFAVNGADGEGVGLAVEVPRGLQKLIPVDKLVEVLSEVVSGACGESLAVAVLLNPGALPKTSSGKLQRSACRQGWLDQSLDAYAVYERGQFILEENHDAVEIETAAKSAFDELELALANIWASVLKKPSEQSLNRNSHFILLGGNSLAAAQVSAGIEAHWGVSFPVRALFEHPRLADCADVLRTRLTDSGQTKITTIPVLDSNQKHQSIPLSPAQQRQWFLWKLDPSSTAYHIQGALRLRGSLNVKSFEKAFNALVQRHESLYTLFREGANGEIEQYLKAEPSLTLQCIDLSDVKFRGASDEAKQVSEILKNLNKEPFDLTFGPLVRMSLIHLSDSEQILAMVMHHIIADGVSMQILVDELAAHYAEIEHEHSAGLPDLSVQYMDYSAWKRKECDEHERQLNYWREQLGGEYEALNLPVDFPRKAVANYQAGLYDLEIPKTLATQLRSVAENTHSTLFTVLLAGFQVLLFRYTGHQEIRLGVPVANRDRSEIQNVAGLFVNTVVLCNAIDGRTLLSQVLQQALSASLDAHANQGLPFEKLVEVLQPDRSLSHNPLFQVMFNHLQEDYGDFESLSGLTVCRESFPADAAQFELVLDTREGADGHLQATFTYAKELFSPSTIEHLAEHYLSVLHGFAQQLEQAVGELELLNVSERKRLEQWGINGKCYPNEELIHHLIEQQVQVSPDATALIFEDEKLTYAELNIKANQLAHYLTEMGVCPEVKVGIAVERSTEMVVGLLAVLKAGGAYVPLDPEYPPERLAYMIQDSGISLLLTQRHLSKDLAISDSVHVLMLDNLNLTDTPKSNPQVLVHGENLAYVIYTSGSTGQPKGVCISHRNLAKHSFATIDFAGLTKLDRMLQFSTLNFDGCIEQLFPPLVVGAAMVIRGQTLWDSNTFLHELLDKQITVVDITTAYWLLLVQDFVRMGVNDYGALRQLHVGGEAMPPEGIKAWRDAGLSHVKLLNAYGPTEATVTAAVMDCDSYLSTDKELSRQIAIGSPLAGRKLYVVDDDLNYVPQGVPGELCIGGDLLSRGYLNRASLSASSFVANPFDSQGSCLYRTGDLVHWNKEGYLEYLGRIDHQVKIRGFRVELGEIESELLAQPEIKEAVVVLNESQKNLRLIAYVSKAEGQVVNVTHIRERLSQSLPDYMHLSAIVVMGSLPFNTNGKVDRKALPEPSMVPANEYQAPKNEMEVVLASIWSEILEVDNVGRSDNFFDLGGHSLALLKLQQQLKTIDLISMPTVIDLFKYPTIETLAEFLSGGEQVDIDREHEIAGRAARQRQGFLSRPQRTKEVSA